MASLADDGTLIHRIDRNDRIIFVNDNWLSFASENGAPGLSERRVLNQSLWDFISGWQVRHLYLLLLNRLRKLPGAHVIIPFRCDSPEVRRFMEMDVHSLGQGVIEFKSRVVRIEARNEAAHQVKSAQWANESLNVCSICNKIQIGKSEWLEIDEAIARYNLLSEGHLPQLTYGRCSSCYGMLLQRLKPLKDIFRDLNKFKRIHS